jgi:hypothetical protein
MSYWRLTTKELDISTYPTRDGWTYGDDKGTDESRREVDERRENVGAVEGERTTNDGGPTDEGQMNG